MPLKAVKLSRIKEAAFVK